MSEKKWLTITVPYEEHESPFCMDGRGDVRPRESKDRRAWIWVRRDRSEIRVQTLDIHEAIVGAWPLRDEPIARASLTAIQARHDAAGDGRRMDLGDGWQAHEDRGVLLDEIREADERARFANDDRMRAIRELGTTRRCAHGADREIAEASDALVALGMPEDGRPLAERIRALAPAPAPQTIKAPLYVPAAGCDDCGNDPGQRHAVGCQSLSLAWLGGTREATIAKLPADIAALVRDDAPLTLSERAELAGRASPETRTFLAAVKAGATVADLETVLRAYAAEDRERKAWAAVAPPPEPDIGPANTP